MKDPARERYPAYLPHAYRLYLRLRKLYRQTMVRCQEMMVRRRRVVAEDAFEADGISIQDSSTRNPGGAINKCSRWMEDDLARPDVKAIVDEIVSLKAQLSQRGLRFTNTAGNFLPREYYPESERGKLWENAWMIRHSGVKSSDSTLDIGGASTIFSFYLASLGCRVRVIDNDWANCGTIYNARYVGQRMRWNLTVLDYDVCRALPFPDASFEKVFSVCVLEHLPSSVRQALMREVGRILKPRGIAGLTFDYDSARPLLIGDRGLRYAGREKLECDVIRPSGLKVLGNTDWIDACPKDTFLGALFLHKD